MSKERNGIPLILHPDIVLEGEDRLGTLQLVDIIQLAMAVFDHVEDIDWKISDTTLPSGKSIVHLKGRLGSITPESYGMVVLDIQEDATAAHLAEIREDNPQVFTGGERQSHLRMGLRNNIWSDFIGWFSLAKEMWDNDLKNRMLRYRVAFRHAFFDIHKGEPVRFPVGALVEIRPDMRAIRPVVKNRTAGTALPDWVEIDPTDTISSIPRAIGLGVLVAP